MKFKYFFLVIWIVACANLGLAQAQEISPSDRLAWFKEARFGMFIHWGIYAVPAEGEWYQYEANVPAAAYENYAAQFNPVKFNAKEWVALAKAAGMKYMVITAKHHDGFCMFDTKLTKYNIVDATPYHHDPLQDLAKACQEAEIPLCFYYSSKDWHHPKYPIQYTFRMKSRPEGFLAAPHPEADYLSYLDYMKGQLRELLSNYGPVGIIWFDYGLGFDFKENREKAQEIVKMIHALQPHCLINNRLGGIGADYGTPEQTIPGSRQTAGFEVCMTLNQNWGYSKNDHDWKDSKTVVRNLVDIVGKSGNYLLNVGPTAEGVIPEEAATILKRTGQWLQKNGESIYGADGGPELNFWWNSDIDMKITARSSKWYLHLFTWPKDQKVFLDDVPEGFGQAYLLADKDRAPLKITFYNNHKSLMLHLPPQAPDECDSVIALEFKADPKKGK